jgi:sterol desaturase/sphingolipid hydroxylase (fatty acid hydroxylase superfamily)
VLPHWFEYVMNTLSHHRVHHATNPRYLDMNYAGTLSSGTACSEPLPKRSREKIRCGIVKQLVPSTYYGAAFSTNGSALRVMSGHAVAA